MNRKYRIPSGEPEFNVWMQGFALNFPTVADELNESAAVERIKNDAITNNYIILRFAAVESNRGEESKVKQGVMRGNVNAPPLDLPTPNLPEPPRGVVFNAGVWDYANNLVQRIIKNPACTPEIEAMLDIDLKGGGGNIHDHLTGKIKSITAGGGGAVVLKCAMQGMKGYAVYCQRGSKTEFERVGDSMQEEFDDERPNLVAGQPETRNYKVIMLEKNKPAGDFSDVKNVVTKP